MAKKLFILLSISFLYSCELQVEKVDNNLDTPQEETQVVLTKIKTVNKADEKKLKLIADIKNIRDTIVDGDFDNLLGLIKDLYKNNSSNIEIMSLYTDIYIKKGLEGDLESGKEAIKLIESFIENNKGVEKKELAGLYSKLGYFYEVDNNYELAEKKYKLSIMFNKDNYEGHERLLGLYMNNKKFEDFNKNFQIALDRVVKNTELSRVQKDYLLEKFNKIALEVKPKENTKKGITWK